MVLKANIAGWMMGNVLKCASKHRLCHVPLCDKEKVILVLFAPDRSLFWDKKRRFGVE